MSRQSFVVLLTVASIFLSAATAYGRFDAAKDAALLGWWPFDEGTGAVAIDASGNGNDGTINGSILVRVDSLLDSNAWAKAGVMIRESLQPGSKHAMVVVTPGNGISFQRRPATDGASESTDAAGLATPYWIKLTRTGNLFTAQRSEDAVTWIDIASGTPVEIPTAA